MISNLRSNSLEFKRMNKVRSSIMVILLSSILLLVYPGLVDIFCSKIEDFIPSQEEIKYKLRAVETELANGFDLASQIKRQELEAVLLQYKKQLTSEFFISNQKDAPIKVTASYANLNDNEWTSPEDAQQIVSPGETVPGFLRTPLFGSDRTIFIGSFPFMFLCADSKFGTVTHFRRGGIIFPLTQPETKEYEYEGTKYIVSWTQGKNKALDIFDINITVKKG